MKEVISSVLEGKGMSWMKEGRVNKLMEDENYRNFVVSRLNRNMDQKVPEDAVHVEDVVSEAYLKLRSIMSLMQRLSGSNHNLKKKVKNN